MPPTPLRSSGAAQTLRLGTDMTASSPFELSAPRHPACLLFTITSEQDNGGHWHAPLQNLSLISERSKVSHNQPKDWWSQTGSNRRPQACKASALPTELWPRPSGLWSSLKLVGLSGLEPLTSRLSGVCSNHLSYRPSRDPCGSL